MQTGKIEANLVELNQRFNLSYIPELIERKIAGAEQSVLGAGDRKFYQGEFERLYQELEAASNGSQLPDDPTCKQQLNDWLVRVRLENFSGYS